MESFQIYFSVNLKKSNKIYQNQEFNHFIYKANKSFLLVINLVSK